MLGQLHALIAFGAIWTALAVLSVATSLLVMTEGAATACAAKSATVVVARRVLKNMLN